MTPKQRASQFIKRLRQLASRVPHTELAEYLGVDRPLMRNWLYRDSIADWRLKKLKHRLDRKWRDIFRKR